MDDKGTPQSAPAGRSLQSVGLLMLVLGLLVYMAAFRQANLLGAALLAGGALLLIAARIARHYSRTAAAALIVLGAGLGTFFCARSLRRADYFRKADEAVTRGELAGIRGALSAYHDANSWSYPEDLGMLKFKPFPSARIPPYHKSSRAVLFGPVPDDAGGWRYDGDPASSSFGRAWVNCTHTDSKGRAWTSY